jgi:RHS repeat-associated protein
LGNTNKLTNSSETTIAEYLYQAFGKQTVLTGSLVNPFTWGGRQGYYRQADAQDYWIRARVMNPTLGRWTSRDMKETEWEKEADLYLYVNNNPIQYNDPTGNSRDCGDPDCCTRKILKDPCGSALKNKWNENSNGTATGIIVCCDGKKFYCVYLSKPESNYIGINRCAKEHEFNHSDAVDCPIKGFCRPDYRDNIDGNREECRAHAITAMCLNRWSSRECSKYPEDSKDRTFCMMTYGEIIAGTCETMKRTYNCKKEEYPRVCKDLGYRV